MRYCEVTGGVRLYVQEFGAGAPIVFVNAGQVTHRMWESQVAHFALAYRTITWDWRGTGASDKPATGYTVEVCAADLCALIERMGAAPALVVGHGIGTHAMLLAADARPELVKAMVLVSAAPWFSGERDGAAGGVSQAFLDYLARTNALADERGVPYARACEELGDWLFHRPQSPAVMQWLLDQAFTWPQFVINEYARSMRDLDHRERMRRIGCPTLIIQGRHDRKQRYEGAVTMAKLIRGARLVTLEDSAHMGEIEEVRAFNRHVGAFFASQR